MDCVDPLPVLTDVTIIIINNDNRWEETYLIILYIFLYRDHFVPVHIPTNPCSRVNQKASVTLPWQVTLNTASMTTRTKIVWPIKKKNWLIM